MAAPFLMIRQCIIFYFMAKIRSSIKADSHPTPKIFPIYFKAFGAFDPIGRPRRNGLDLKEKSGFGFREIPH